MAVALDAVCGATGSTGGSATTTGTIAGGITVGGGANRILILGIQFNGDPAAITACNWDQSGTPQAMTQIGTLTFEGDSSASVTMFGLINPTAGAKNISASWTNARTWTLGLISFTGADQGSVAGTCANFTSGNPGMVSSTSYPNPSGATINSPVNDFCVFFAASNSGGFASANVIGTSLYFNNTNVSGAGVYKAGAGAATSIAAGAANTTFPAAYVGCDIAAVGSLIQAAPPPAPGTSGSSIIRARQFSSQGRRQLFG